MGDAEQPRPPWVDAELSAQLPNLCAQGEGQTLEFKSQLPAQAHDIAKTFAAFASSNNGLILYGVRDDGNVVGLEGANDAQRRDAIARRIHGAAKEVQPPVHPAVTWAMHCDRVVCGVAVEKGFAALYYSNQRPIVRRGATSRPAEPGEVEEVFRKRYAGRGDSASLSSTKEIRRRLFKVLELMNEGRYEPLNIVDLARAMELASPAELDAVFEGRQAPTFAMLDQFCACFAVDTEWLTTGRSQPFLPQVEHRVRVAEYRELLERDPPEHLYLVRSSSDAGESFFVAQRGELRYWRLSDVWHVSDHVGGGGAADLMALHELFKGWINELPKVALLGRQAAPHLVRAIIDGEIHPGIVKRLPLSHWWDDLTDLEHKWTTREESRKSYGKGFVAAQDVLRSMLAGKGLPWEKHA